MGRQTELKFRRLSQRKQRQITKIRDYARKEAICERIAEDLEARMRAGDDPIGMVPVFEGFVKRHLPLEVSFEGISGFETDESGDHFLGVCFEAVCPQRFRLQASGDDGERRYLGLRVILIFESLGDGKYEGMVQRRQVNPIIAQMLGDRCPVQPKTKEQLEVDRLVNEHNVAAKSGRLLDAEAAMSELAAKGEIIAPADGDTTPKLSMAPIPDPQPPVARIGDPMAPVNIGTTLAELSRDPGVTVTSEASEPDEAPEHS